MIYRAHAYVQTRYDQFSPKRYDGDMLVFFEAHSDDHAKTRLPYLLALAWQCGTDQIEIYNLQHEGELLRQSLCGDDAGDARLLETGWHHGPLFPRRARTLVLGTAQLIERIEAGWAKSHIMRAKQQVQALASERGSNALRGHEVRRAAAPNERSASGAAMGLHC